MNPISLDVFEKSGKEVARLINNAAKTIIDYDASLVILMELLFKREDEEKVTYVTYSRQNVKDIKTMIDNPIQVWKVDNPDIGSDTVFELWDDSDHKAYTLPLVKVTLTTQPKTRGWTKGAFFPYLIDKEKIRESEEPEAQFIREELQRIAQGTPSLAWKEDFQLLFFEKEEELRRLLNEKDEEGNDNPPISDVCLSTPCALWALKGQISEEDYRELALSKVLYGTCTNVTSLTDFLKKHGYGYTIARYPPSSNITKFKDGKSSITKGNVCLVNCEGHWMKKGKIRFFDGKQNRFVSLVTFLTKCIQKKLLYKMSAYEIAGALQNQSFAGYEYIKSNIDVIYDRIPEDTLVTVPDDWVTPIKEIPFKPEKKFPTWVVFFDFEADTSGIYHKPFLVAACGIELNADGTVKRELFPMKTWWGENCARDFMEEMYKLAAKSPCSGGKKKSRKLRLYAFNHKYDLCFVMPYIKQLDGCIRDGKYYSMKGIYYKDKNRSGKYMTWFEFWDAYMLFAAPLRKCAQSTSKGGFLKEEQAKTIKKEVFPYNAYTYKFFEKYKDTEWVPVEEMKVGFMEEDNEGKELFNEKKYNEFLLTLKHTLPFIPEYKEEETYSTRSSWLTYQSDLYKQEEYHYVYDSDRMYYQNYCRSEEKYTETFNFKKYAEFYCVQDVNCLKNIMINMEEICMAREVEGVTGNVPFKIHIWNHRTASSIGYDNLLMNVLYKKDDEGNWVPRHDIYFTKNEAREIIQKSVRGGTVMLGCNEKHYFETHFRDRAHLIQDCDANSLYPSTMATLLWITDGKPSLLKGHFSTEEFMERFTHPWAPIGKEHEKAYNDGIIHLTSLKIYNPSHIPRLFVKNEKTGLNEAKNWFGDMDTWVNAKDVWDLIDYQQAKIQWDKALVFTGERHFEIRDCMKNTYEFRKPNKSLGVGNIAKLMMNSSYGKSTLKPKDEEILIIDGDKIKSFYNANGYRIKAIEPMQGKEDPNITSIMKKYMVKVYKKDTGAVFNMFGSNVLAGSKCLMRRPMALIEEVAEERGQHPHIFYTDTDSMHVLGHIVDEAAKRFEAKYGFPMIGNEVGQFHSDFDRPASFKTGENPIGAYKSIFDAKKVYVDVIVGDQGSEGAHMRMKGVPNSCISLQDYEDLYEGKTIEKNLLSFGKISLEIRNGCIKSRKAMKRALQCGTPLLQPQPQAMEPTPYQPPEWQEWMEGDTPKLEWEAMELQEEIENQKRQRDEIDIETEDEEELPDPKKLKCYESIEDPNDLNMIISIENGHPPTHWERRVFDEGWDPEADEDMISWWKVLGKEQREWLLKLRGDK